MQSFLLGDLPRRHPNEGLEAKSTRSVCMLGPPMDTRRLGLVAYTTKDLRVAIGLVAVAFLFAPTTTWSIWEGGFLSLTDGVT